MPESLSEFVKKNPDIEIISNQEFIVDSSVNFNNNKKNFSIKDCHFKIGKNGRLSFTRINSLIDCTFDGRYKSVAYKKDNGQIHFFSCNLISIKIEGEFNAINFNNCDVIHFEDTSTSNNWSAINSKFFNPIIKGGTLNLQIENSLFSSINGIYESRFQNQIVKKIEFHLRLALIKIGCHSHFSEWDKRVSEELTCEKSAFERIKLNPFYFAAKCYDKNSLELSGASFTDNWSRLRKRYSGINLIIVFILTFIFFLPLITKSFLLLLASKLDTTLLNVEHIELWKLILFEDEENVLIKMIYIFLTTVLILYNIGRLWLTVSISKLKEEEQFLNDSNFQLVSIHPDKLVNQIRIDKILTIFFWLSIGYSLIKIWNTLMIQVPIF